MSSESQNNPFQSNDGRTSSETILGESKGPIVLTQESLAQDLERAYVARISQGTPNDYFQLLKPRVMSLVVFTGLTGLVLAPVDVHPLIGFIAVLCIALGAGAAGALNMAFEGETDALMRRTRARPVAAKRVSREDALGFGAVLSALSVLMMALAVNLLSAFLLSVTIVYYVWLYTLVLKRNTTQNIVIGGAAGAFPPVIGWASAANAVPLEAWVLFAIIFLWTPPHSWALALYTSDDYKRAGIPMLPVIKGASHTRLMIWLYSLIFVPVTVLPYVLKTAGLAYLCVAIIGGLGFLWLAFKLYCSKAGDSPDVSEKSLYNVRPETKSARNLFAYSILYLSLLFATLLIESLILRVIL